MERNLKIDKKLSLVPHSPGCYLMKDINGVIIYVGKSKNLKNRLSSYFKSNHTGKTACLVRDIDEFEYILTSSELEALLLEINLIKKYSPKYNILLRDDKTYPYIEITNEKYFRLLVVRNPDIKKTKNNIVFGPFPNVTAARKVVDLINRIYPLRKCSTFNKKECLYYHIGECLGYCTKKIDENILKSMKVEIISFLNGNNKIIVKKLENLMEDASQKLQFERALEYRDLLDYINITLEKQRVELDDDLDRDVINYYVKNNYLCINMLFIRGGKLLDSRNSLFPMVDTLEEELTTFISKFYDEHIVKPKEIFVPDIVDNMLLKEVFKVNFITPKKGNKKKILDLAYNNAVNYYNEQINFLIQDENKTLNSLNELASILKLDNLSRVEIFDNSNLFGNFNVSGMVVFVDGKPAKNEYRKFKISNDVNDDYGTMREVIYRRYFRILKENLMKPDLIVVDGGEGQLKIAREVIESLGLNIPSIGLKKDDKHNTSTIVGLDPISEINIDKRSDLFFLLTRMQDEVHNFTINYHRQIRSKGSLSSILDNIEGIGEVRKNKLLKKYKTLSKMKEASDEELEEILPVNLVSNFKKIIDKL